MVVLFWHPKLTKTTWERRGKHESYGGNYLSFSEFVSASGGRLKMFTSMLIDTQKFWKII